MLESCKCKQKDKCKDKCKSKFFKVYHCNNEYYKISLTVNINYDTFDIIYSVTNESSTSFNGVIEVVSSMLGSKKCKKMLGVDETITFEGNLTDSIIYNGEFKEDISVAYLRFPKECNECNFVMSNIVTIKPQDGPIPPPIQDSWIYDIKFSQVNSIYKTISIMNSLNSNSEAKDIEIEMLYFFGMLQTNITISPDSDYPNEITLTSNKFIFNIPSLLPGEIRVYRFEILNYSPIINNVALIRVKSTTPLLFQPNQTITYYNN